MFLSFIRIIKFSLQDIVRNVWLTIVTLTILVLTLFSINTLLTVQVISDSAINAIKEKVDFTIYMNAESEEADILELKAQIANLEDVKSVQYISKTQALDYFRKTNEDNPEVLQALRELGRNPLSPSLVIVPNDPDNTDDLIHQLNIIESSVIESRNFTDNRTVLDKINSITDKVKEVGLFISAVFIFTTLVVMFNVIRVSVFTHRMEIAIMRLVGASNSFVYMPFVASAIIYTLLGVLIIISVFYPFLSLLQPYLQVFFLGYNVDIISYFVDNFWQIFGLQFIVVAVINILASFIAARKYAQV